jgi:uncharacterized tellurite resistance protein B-like protein
VDPQYAKKVCELVAGIIETDDDLHPAEGSLLRRVMTRLGLSAHGDDAVVPTLKGSEAAKAIGELPEEVRSQALEMLIDAAIVDGKVVPAEQEYLEAVGNAMGADKAELDRRIEQRLLQS